MFTCGLENGERRFPEVDLRWLLLAEDASKNAKSSVVIAASKSKDFSDCVDGRALVEHNLIVRQMSKKPDDLAIEAIL